MNGDPILLRAGEALGVAGGLLLLTTVVAFFARWGVRFRLVGVTSFTLLLAISCAAFAFSYVPRVRVDGAVTVPVVFDDGDGLVVAAATPDLAPEAFGPTVEQVARNLRGSGRGGDGGVVRVRLRRLEPAAAGAAQPVILAEAQRNLATGAISVSR
ncbi:MAG: DUF2518 family protein [Synechococcaceae cyanobacterium]|jgi:hypothetical protein